MSLKVRKADKTSAGFKKRAEFTNEVALAIDTIGKLSGFDFTTSANELMKAAFGKGNTIRFVTTCADEVEFKCESNDAIRNLVALSVAMKESSELTIPEGADDDVKAVEAEVAEKTAKTKKNDMDTQQVDKNRVERGLDEHQLDLMEDEEDENWKDL